VKSNAVSSQVQLHQQYGGVVPEIASRAHIEWLNRLIDDAVQQSQCPLTNLNAIAVAHCPGLVGCLIVGVAAAKTMAFAMRTPLIGINHLHAHLYGGFLSSDPTSPPRLPDFPALGLVVSGGHTSLFHLNSFIDIRRIGATVDDAIGEAFDKTAALLGLGYPGGAAIEKLARQGDAHAINFPVSLLDAESLDFSYSGLKTAVRYHLRGRRGSERSIDDLTPQELADAAAAFQRAAVAPIRIKLCRAMQRYGFRSILVGGGVSANHALRQTVQQTADEFGVPVSMPALAFCTDNAAMLAGLAFHRLAAGLTDSLNLPAIATV
jgi:N6-L-threonylcarbamoyladenine synthase